jgi:enoyl-CoA hydratase/carnithine racemase
MAMTDELVRVHIADHVATVTLNAPPLNLIDARMQRALSETFAALALDDAVSCAILTGAGETAFSAGGDVRQARVEEDAAETRAAEGANDTWAAVAGFPKPLIAALNGQTLGRGLQLALCCDIRFAAERATFALPEVGFGFIPGSGGTQRLPRLVGRAMALEMILTGATYDVAAALGMGLVSRVLPAADLLPACSAVAAVIKTRGPLALRYAKEAVLRGLDGSLAEGMRIEADLSFILQTTDDRREGIRAFLEKRKPEFHER